MTLDEIEKLAHAIDDFDPQDRSEDSDEGASHCLSCNGEYRVDVGLEPTALDNNCVHDALTDFARALLAVLPVVRAAERLRSGNHRPFSRPCLKGDLFDAIDTMRRLFDGCDDRLWTLVCNLVTAAMLCRAHWIGHDAEGMFPTHWTPGCGRQAP